MNLHEKNVIVRLSLGAFRATKKDRQATAEVAHEKRAQASRISLVKKLLPEDVFAPVEQHDRETYDLFNRVTMPWLDGGADEADADQTVVPIGRLCRTSVFPELMGQMKERRRAREPLVEAGLREYSRLVADPDALRAALGTLYKPADYPEADRVRKRFRFDVKVFPVPADDWRLQMAEEEVEEVRQMAAAQQAEAARQAQTRLVTEITEPLRKVLTMLTKPEGERQIRTVTLDNLRDIAERITALNVTGDDRFERLRQDILMTVTAYSPDELRSHAGRRVRAARSAEGILGRLAGLVPGTEFEPTPEPAPEPVVPVAFDAAAAPSRSEADLLLELAAAEV